MPSPLVSLEEVTLVYEQAGREPTVALEGVSLELRAGERVCVLGANGSGKTTLASVLCGLLAPDSGTVQLVGEDVCVNGTVDLDAYRRARRGVGLVFQNPDDQMVTSVVADDVAFGPENLGVPADEIRGRVAREIHRVALDAYAEADPRRLSGGQQQRVAIAAALAMEPQVVVFDEPGALLDVRGRAAILRVMGRLCEAGVGIVHITHYMEEALGADRVVVLDHGRVALAGTPEEVFAEGDALAGLGLEQPFAGRLATRLAGRSLSLAWTCDENTLVDELEGLAESRCTTNHSAIERHHLDSTVHYEGTCRRRLSDSSEYPTEEPQVSGNDTLVNRELRAFKCPHDASEDNKEPQTASREHLKALEVRRASFSYQGAGGRKALDEVSLVVPAGRQVAIVGQTGSGKSTLLRLLCALDVPDMGEVLVGGTSTRVPGRGRRARAARAQLRAQVGFVMQRPERQLFANTVEEDVAFGPTNQGLSPAEVRERVEGALATCGLTELRRFSPFELSGGKQRLCAIAGIIAMRPATLVLDEPTAGLDPRSRAELRALLTDLHAQGTTVVQVTHSMEDAAHAEEVVVLDQSRVLTAGTPEEVFSREHEALLSEHGLGLPLPLAWALRLERAGIAAPGSLGQPLTTDALVEALAGVLPAKPEPGKPPALTSPHTAAKGHVASMPPACTLDEGGAEATIRPAPGEGEVRHGA